MTRAAVYLRQSLDRDGSGDAVARQRSAVHSLCEARGWTVVAEYVDNSVSASKDRDASTAFGRLLADATAGRFDVVAAFAVDRLARRLSDIERLISTGVKAATVQGGLDLTTPEGEAQAGILAAFARMEVRQKAERQRAAHAQRVARGLPPTGKRAIGWERDGATVRPAEAAAVRAGAASILAGGSLRSVARSWNAAGLLTADGGPWKPYAVRTALLNPRVAGLRARQTGRDTWEIVGPGLWTALLEESTWRALVEVITDPARKTTTGTARVSLLAGLATCGVCGHKVITGGTQRGVRTYKCLPVMHLSRAAGPVDDYVSAVVVERLSRPDATELLRAEARADLRRTRTELVARRKRLDGLSALVEDGTLTVDQVRDSAGRLRAQVAELERALADAGRVDVLAPLVGDAAGRWAVLDLDARRAVITALLDVVVHPPGRGARTFDPATVEIRWKGAR